MVCSQCEESAGRDAQEESHFQHRPRLAIFQNICESESPESFQIPVHVLGGSHHEIIGMQQFVRLENVSDENEALNEPSEAPPPSYKEAMIGKF